MDSINPLDTALRSPKRYFLDVTRDPFVQRARHPGAWGAEKEALDVDLYPLDTATTAKANPVPSAKTFDSAASPHDIAADLNAAFAEVYTCLGRWPHKDHLQQALLNTSKLLLVRPTIIRVGLVPYVRIAAKRVAISESRRIKHHTSSLSDMTSDPFTLSFERQVVDGLLLDHIIARVKNPRYRTFLELRRADVPTMEAAAAVGAGGNRRFPSNAYRAARDAAGAD